AMTLRGGQAWDPFLFAITHPSPRKVQAPLVEKASAAGRIAKTRQRRNPTYLSLLSLQLWGLDRGRLSVTARPSASVVTALKSSLAAVRRGSPIETRTSPARAGR